MRKIIKKFESEDKKLTAIVRLDREWEEYSVQFYEDGDYVKNADYFADSRADAFSTAQYHCGIKKSPLVAAAARIQQRQGVQA